MSRRDDDLSNRDGTTTFPTAMSSSASPSPSLIHQMNRSRIVSVDTSRVKGNKSGSSNDNRDIGTNSESNDDMSENADYSSTATSDEDSYFAKNLPSPKSARLSLASDTRSTNSAPPAQTVNLMNSFMSKESDASLSFSEDDDDDDDHKNPTTNNNYYRSSGNPIIGLESRLNRGGGITAGANDFGDAVNTGHMRSSNDGHHAHGASNLIHPIYTGADQFPFTRITRMHSASSLVSNESDEKARKRQQLDPGERRNEKSGMMDIHTIPTGHDGGNDSLFALRPADTFPPASVQTPLLGHRQHYPGMPHPEYLKVYDNAELPAFVSTPMGTPIIMGTTSSPSDSWLLGKGSTYGALDDPLVPPGGNYHSLGRSNPERLNDHAPGQGRTRTGTTGTDRPHSLEAHGYFVEDGRPLFSEQSRGSNVPRKYRLYWERWVMLGYIAFLNLLSDWTCYSVAPIATLANQSFGKIYPDQLVVIFLSANAISSACEPVVLSRLGLRRTIVLGALLLMMGSVIKSGGQPSFVNSTLQDGQGEWRVYLGFFLVGLSQPLYQCTPALLSASWFPENERTLATGIALNSNQVGIGK